jgi:hypothetical protein
MKIALSLLALSLCVNCTYAQTPQNPTPQLPAQPKQQPTPQQPPQQPPPPVQQMYRLVPVEQPAQPVPPPAQYVTVAQVPPPSQPLYTTTAALPTSYSTQYAFSTQQTGQRQVVLGPGPLSLSAAWVGQRLATLGKTHVFTINHQIIRPVNPAPIQPAPPVQYVIQTAQQQPQQTVQLIMQPQQPTAPIVGIPYRSESVPAPPLAPQPTPQSQPNPNPPTTQKHALWGMLGH